mgnify:CR=1 FL=1
MSLGKGHIMTSELLVQEAADWQEYQVDVCVNTAGMYKIGRFTFRARDAEAMSATIRSYHEVHPILMLNVQSMTVRPVEGNAESYFTPIEQLEPQRSALVRN